MLKFIDNIGEYFSANFFDDDFAKRVLDKSGHAPEQYAGFNRQLNALREPYYKYKRKLLEEKLRTKDKIWETHQFHDRLLAALGYPDLAHPYEWVYLDAQRVVPVRHTLVRGAQPHLMVLEMQPLIAEHADEVPDGLFEQQYALEGDADDAADDDAATVTTPQRYRSRQWSRVWDKPADGRIEPSVVNRVVSSLFLLPTAERPRYILLLAGNGVFLLEQEKWFRGSYLRFDLEELFAEAGATAATRNYYAVLYFLLGRETLAPDGERVLLDQLDEDSHRHAYAVTVDLKQGVIRAVEALANEAIWYRSQHPDAATFDTGSAALAGQLKDDCLTVVYRLLFLFYAEARPDLNLLPTDDATYRRGYSLEMLRDLELVPLHAESSRNGYFFDASLKALFRLLHTGHHEADAGLTTNATATTATGKPHLRDGFAVRRLDSPLFDDGRFSALAGVRFRNVVWQEIIQLLSLTRQQANRPRGRISYANLGVNQLGSVYESLLAFRGFFAQEDLLDVHPAGKPKEASFLVARARRDDFRDNEIRRDERDQEVVIRKGTFVYRLSGRDRQRSASYYTPEVLTRCTVRYTLLPLLERLALPKGDKNRLEARDLLDLRLLEPAMGAAAFHNELVNQLAEAYLTHRQPETDKRVPPDRYQQELQKVKAYLATHNVYGVDLNPTAIELGKLSLWLNAMHPQMETPFFGHRLAVGNAVVGAWLRVYPESAVRLEPVPGNRAGGRFLPKKWWETAPRLLTFEKKTARRKPTEIYHFLLPDPQMVASADARLLKDAYPAEVKHVREWRKEWQKPLTGAELATVHALGQRVDQLLTEHYRFELTLRRRTEGRHTVWEAATAAATQAELLPYAEKERLAGTRHRHGAPYFKLKLLLDYWCALWFWDVRRAKDLPTRQEWWADLAELLGPGPAPAGRPLAALPQLSAFGGAGVQLPLMAEPAPETLATADPTPLPNEAPEKYEVFNATLFAQAPRLPLVQALAERHRFFHPQLEFLEVFWERGGFDVIVGNPPWLKVQFEAQDLVGESFPEVLIRKTSAPQVRAKLAAYLTDGDHRETFLRELIENEATATFLNAHQNYPLLAGQQTNLYKCVLENGFRLLGARGFMGLLHPESVYDDPNGQPLRREMYQRLRYHFQFQNELGLFAEVHNEAKFGTHVYDGTRRAIDFISINNLFHPDTVAGCFLESEHAGLCGGIKLKDETSGKYRWNTRPHPKRRVQVTRQVLQIIDDTFESSGEPEASRLVGIHSGDIISVLRKLAGFAGKVDDQEVRCTVCWDETNAVNAGNITRRTTYPDVAAFEMVYSGPHFFVSNPLYKTPRAVCDTNKSYDIIDLQLVDQNTVARTNYVPPQVEVGYADTLPGFQIGVDASGKPQFDSWFDYYKLSFRRMLSQIGERTLTGAILPPKTAHIHPVISVTFRDQAKLIEATGLCSSVVMDFFVKSSGRSDLYESTIAAFPLGIAPRYKPALFVRTLLLNCVNRYYADLWAGQWQAAYQQEAWSRPTVPGATDFAALTPAWGAATPLRTWQARRQALVEIDVLAAQALGLTLAELVLLYEVQFPVLQQNEDDTWYDQRGTIVFTCSKGLTGIGLDRKAWEQVKERTATDAPVPHRLTSELYAGREVHYYPPFVKCDRVEDYRVAWAHFAGRFGENEPLTDAQ